MYQDSKACAFIFYVLFGIDIELYSMAGITVNAGIYLTTEYRTISSASGRYGLRQYVKAFNRKIVPTLLTILSGMLFSVLAIVFVMPVFFPLKRLRLREL